MVVTSSNNDSVTIDTTTTPTTSQEPVKKTMPASQLMAWRATRFSIASMVGCVVALGGAIFLGNKLYKLSNELTNLRTGMSITHATKVDVDRLERRLDDSEGILLRIQRRQDEQQQEMKTHLDKLEMVDLTIRETNRTTSEGMELLKQQLKQQQEQLLTLQIQQERHMAEVREMLESVKHHPPPFMDQISIDREDEEEDEEEQEQDDDQQMMALLQTQQQLAAGLNAAMMIPVEEPPMVKIESNTR